MNTSDTPGGPSSHDDDKLIGRLRDDLRKTDPAYAIFDNPVPGTDPEAGEDSGQPPAGHEDQPDTSHQ
jgi:hypothetical protein